MASSQSRKLRRAAAHLQRKLDRKILAQGFLPLIPAGLEATLNLKKQDDPSPVAEPENPKPKISQRRLDANRANSLLSTGPKLPETKAISSQNHTTHGLARHKKDGGASAPFKLLESEDPNGFEALKANLTTEHQPTTETESILVNGMAESHWLSIRAQRLQDTCINPETGVIHDPKLFALYLRYQTTHTRAFHKSFSELQKLRAQRTKEQIGFEAQRLKNELHEMKKYPTQMQNELKNIAVFLELSKFTTQLIENKRNIPEFAEEFAAQLAARNLTLGDQEVFLK